MNTLPLMASYKQGAGRTRIQSDGFAYGGWAAPFDDEAIGAAVKKMLDMPIDLFLGRKTFDIWAAFWPQHGDIWPNVNTATKYVASNTMTSSEWQPSVFLSGDVAKKVAELKQGEGPDLHIWGSGNLLQTLMKHDLVDNFWLMIYPITLGEGKTSVCRGHDPGGVQSDGKHCRFDWRHSRELRARRRSPNRKFLNIRAVERTLPRVLRFATCRFFLARADYRMNGPALGHPQTLVSTGTLTGQDTQMRNVIFAINITLDGCCDHTKQVADDETHEYFTNLLREVDLLVFGRITYQLMVPFWPEVAKNQSMTKASNEFASTFDSINKIVFSRSLDSAEDKNTRIVRTNLHDEILKLKQEQGKNILVGGVSVPSQLIELGLVDEYRFVVGPIVAGEGRRLLEGVSLRERLQLKLVESKIFKSGCVALRYLKQ